MKNILAVILVLALGVFANAQFEMQRSRNNGTEPNVIRPDITNDLSHLGAAYTLGTEAGNLTGNYGNYFQVRMFPKYSSIADIGITIVSYDKDGNQMSFDDISPELGIHNTLGLYAGFGLIIDSGKLFCQFDFGGLPAFGGLGREEWVEDIDLFGVLGGYIDYVAISGSGGVEIREFQFGNGWVQDENSYGFTNMQLIHGYNNGFDQPVSFTNGTYNWNPGHYTFSSKTLAWNAETGAALSGQFMSGGLMGLEAWNNLTFTFGSFERHPVPEPATLLMLGLAAAGIPVVRRWRKR